MEDLIKEILSTVKNKMEENGSYDREAYKQYVEETIEDFKERGHIGDDENEELIEDEILNMWESVEEGLAKE